MSGALLRLVLWVCALPLSALPTTIAHESAHAGVRRLFLRWPTFILIPGGASKFHSIRFFDIEWRVG